MSIALTDNVSAGDADLNNSQVSALLPLRIQNLNYAVDGKPLLHNIGAVVTHPGICIIMGHNGAGKSLLLKALHGLLVPDTGVISWAEQDPSLSTTRKKQALVSQKPLMLNRSVAANIQYVLKLRDKPKEQYKKYLASAGLQDKAKQPARMLSGGEQQRLGIARALAIEPDVLLLDEPTANLDPEATRQIESQIASARSRSIKIVMVTHDVGQARRLADEILFLHAGKLTEHTETKQFFKQPQSQEATEFLSALTG